MPHKKREKIFRAGALLVLWARRVFYVMLGTAMASALLSNQAPPEWRGFFMGLCWFLIGAAAMGLGIFALASLLSGGDIPDLASSTSTPLN